MARKKKSTKTANRSADVVDNEKKLKTGITTSLGFIRTLKDKGATVRPEYPAESLRASLDSLDERNITFLSPNEVVVSAVNSKEPGPSDTITVTMDLSGGSYAGEPLYPKTYPVGTTGDVVVGDFLNYLNTGEILYPAIEYPYSYFFNYIYDIATGTNAYEITFNNDTDLCVSWGLDYVVTINFNGGILDGSMTQTTYSFNVDHTTYVEVENAVSSLVNATPTFVKPEGKIYGFLTTVVDDPSTRFLGDSVVGLDTLYIYWEDEVEPDTYLVTFNLNGGEDYDGEPSFSEDFDRGTDGTDILLRLEDMINSGEVTPPGADEPSYNYLVTLTTELDNIDTRIDDGFVLNSDIDVYALWEKHNIVTVDLNGGEYNGSETYEVDLDDGDSIFTVIGEIDTIIDEPGFVKPEGKVFRFLTVERDDPSTEYTGSVDQSLELFAYWENDEGYASSIISFYSDETGEPVAASLYDSNDEPVGDGTVITVTGLEGDIGEYTVEATGYESDNLSVTYGEDTDVYLNPSYIEYNVTVDLNGGVDPNGDTIFEDVALEGDDYVAQFEGHIVSSITPPEGKTYSCLTTVLNDLSTRVEQGTDLISSDTTYYVYWESEPAPGPTQYDITFDLNGGHYDAESTITESFDEGTDEQELLDYMQNLIDDGAVVREGYYYDTLTTTRDDGGTTINEDGYTVNSNGTLYIYWLPNTVEFTINLGEGYYGSPSQHTINSGYAEGIGNGQDLYDYVVDTYDGIVPPEDMELIGLTTVQDDDSTLIDENFPISDGDNLTLYALWGTVDEPEDIEVTIDLNGGSNRYTGDSDYTTSFTVGVTGYDMNVSIISLVGDEITPPQGMALMGLTTVKDDENTLIGSNYTFDGSDTTFYAFWDLEPEPEE